MPEDMQKLVEEPQGKFMAELVAHFVNSHSSPDKAFIEHMAREHRTLQQSFTRLCVAWFRKLDALGEYGEYDLRNQASVELAQAMRKVLDDHGHLPII